ncbi:MAG: hypothetical protein NC823_02120, partial [Candidatus Omnitrophica bacterium]|nr:hypothetical protein [Candidatus Omnitrophota bacterium]
VLAILVNPDRKNSGGDLKLEIARIGSQSGRFLDAETGEEITARIEKGSSSLRIEVPAREFRLVRFLPQIK